jgi:hypothetical protein
MSRTHYTLILRLKSSIFKTHLNKIVKNYSRSHVVQQRWDVHGRRIFAHRSRVEKVDGGPPVASPVLFSPICNRCILPRMNSQDGTSVLFKRHYHREIRVHEWVTITKFTKNKMPLSTYSVSLRADTNNNEIFDISNTLHTTISTEKIFKVNHGNHLSVVVVDLVDTDEITASPVAFILF